MSISRPATILYVHASDELYGSDVVLLELIRRLDRARFRPLVVLPRDLPYRGKLSAALKPLEVPVWHLDIAVLRRRYLRPAGMAQFGWRLARSVRQLARLMQQENVALVHTNTGAVWSGAVTCRLTGCPHLWHIHEIVTHPPVVRQALAWMATRLSRRVVTISEAVRQHLLMDQPEYPQRITVIHDGVDVRRFHPSNNGRALRQEWGVGADDVLVGQVGRISGWKGQEDFIEAAKIAVRRLPQARFVIAGDVVIGEEWRLAALRQQAAELGDRLIWAGFRDDSPQLMAALDLLVLPSRLPEPFGMVLLEAMASGKPVIATEQGGPLEIVENGTTGVLVPPNDAPLLGSAMVRLGKDVALRQQMGQQARQRVEARFDLTRHAAQFQQLYLELLHGSA